MAARFGKPAPSDPTKVPPGIDTSTFFSPHIVDEVRAVVPIMHAAEKEAIRPAIRLGVQSLTTVLPTDSAFIEVQTKLGQQGDQFGHLLTGIYCILRHAVATRSSVQKINADLKAMNVPPSIADDISEAVRVYRSGMESHALSSRVGFTRLAKLRWRIDVTISSGSLSRVMRPSIVMQLILTNGSIKTFEVSVEQFNQLRYSVAKLLHDMKGLERHPIMKIIREFEKREDERNK